MLAGTLRRASRRVASPLPLYYPCSRTALHSSAIRYDAPEQHPNPNSTQTISIAAAQTSHSSRTNPNPPITSKPKKSLFETLRESAKVYFLGAKQFAENAKVVGRLRKESPDGSKWTRAENALVHQTSNDVRKVLPFFLLLIILPESLPFLMMRGSDIFPSTCVTESQKRQKFARLAKIRMEISASIVQSIEAGGMVSPRQLLSDDFIKTVAKSQHAYFRLSDAPKVQLSMLCKLFGLSSWGFKYQLRNRLIRHSEFLEKDDLLIYYKDGVSSLSLMDLISANEDRGLSTTLPSAEAPSLKLIPSSEEPLTHDRSILETNLQSYLTLTARNSIPLILRGLVVATRTHTHDGLFFDSSSQKPTCERADVDKVVIEETEKRRDCDTESFGGRRGTERFRDVVQNKLLESKR